MRYYTLFTRFLQLQKASLLICLFAIAATSVYAKIPHRVPVDRQVKGRVLDDKGTSVPNVSVIVKGTTIGVNTLDDGTFTIHVPEGKTTLVVSSVGFQTQEVDVKGSNNISVSLVPGTSKLDDVVVVGYATQKKVTVTGAVATVKGTELEKSPSVNLSNDLVGRLPGVTAMQSGGEPGYDGSTILIRGTNTFGITSALIVVDGVPDVSGGLERINPQDVESMSVLKDASAAIYGARAANGVILITTKHGKTGKPQLSYTFNEGISQPTRIPKMANALEYAAINNETTIFDGVDPSEWSAAESAFATTGSFVTTVGGTKTVNAPYSTDYLKQTAAGTDPWFHPNTDWFKTTLNTWSPQQQHSIQIKGGSDNVKYLTTLGYQDQDAYYKNSATGYKQYDLRINLDANVNKYVTTSIGLLARREARAYPTQPASAIFRMLMRGKPTSPEVYPDGLPGPAIENGQNPIVITTNQTGYDDDNRDYVQANGKVEIKIPGVDGLKITGTATADYENEQEKVWQTPWYLYSATPGLNGAAPVLTKSLASTFTSPQLNGISSQTLNLLTSAFVNYDRKIGDHTINLMAAVTKETDSYETFNAYRTNFISPVLAEFNAGGTLGQNITGNGTDLKRLSYFGRADYNYKEKYIVSFLWRDDASSFFSAATRFGFFPGVSAGWRISEEKFFKENVHFFDNLKIRGSWGQLGNDQAVQPFTTNLIYGAYQNNYQFGAYTLGNAAFKTLQESLLANPHFSWEIANNSNIGIEGTILKSHVNFEFDYFYNKRTNLLLPPSGITPLSSGITGILPPTNDGAAENHGYEFTVGYTGSTKDWHYSISVNGGYSKNKIINISEAPGVPAWQKVTGHSFNSNGTGILAYEYAGVFKDQKEIDANTIDYSGVTNQLHPGDMKFVDYNHDGKIDGNDAVRLDKTLTPTFTGGININVGYKAFDLSILFQGATGGLLDIATESGDIGNYLQYSYDHQWTIDHPSSVDPRLANRNDTYYTGGAFATNTYFLRSSNYIRLKNVELGYTLPPSALKKAGISALRVYVSGLNLLTWDKMKIWDPESQAGNGQYYPQARILNGGVRVTF